MRYAIVILTAAALLAVSGPAIAPGAGTEVGFEDGACVTLGSGQSGSGIIVNVDSEGQPGEVVVVTPIVGLATDVEC